MYSHVLAAYQKSLLLFWEKTSKTMSSVADSFKGYQYYEFTVVKNLAEPSRLLAEKGKATSNDDALIDVSASASIMNEPVNALIDISDAQLDDQLLELEKLTTLDQMSSGASQMKSTASKSASDDNLVDISNSTAEYDQLFADLLSSSSNNATTTSSNSTDLLGSLEKSDQENSAAKNNQFLPSSLLNDLLSSMNKVNKTATAAAPPTNPKSKSNWLNLFAELDPIQNPDAIGKTVADEADRSC